MARRGRPEDPADDGRTIADMNVDGMPWYQRGRDHVPADSGGNHYQMTKEEQRAYTWAAVKSALLILCVFGGVFAAFIAFCQFIWFK